MGLFSGVSAVIKKATDQAGRAVQKTGKAASRGFSEGIKTGATGTFEYTTLKPLEAIAPKVIDFARRGQTLAGQASEVQRIAQDTYAQNQGLFGMIPGADALGGLFGGGAPVSGEMPPGMFTPQPAAPSVPVWVWLAAAGAAVVGLVLYLRKSA